MKKRLLLLIITITLLPVSSAFALTGSAYRQYCTSVQMNTTNFYRCGSYVIGVVDNMRAKKAGGVEYKEVCFPDKLNEQEMIQMTLKWIDANPESLNTWAAFAVSMAMHENYKCDCK